MILHPEVWFHSQFTPHSWFFLLSDTSISYLCIFFFFLAKSTPKLRHFSDEQVKSWHASKLCSFKPKLKIKTSSLNDIVLGQILKSNYKDHEELTSLTQTPWTQTPWLRLNQLYHQLTSWTQAVATTTTVATTTSFSSLSLYFQIWFV